MSRMPAFNGSLLGQLEHLTQQGWKFESEMLECLDFLVTRGGATRWPRQGEEQQGVIYRFNIQSP